MFLRKILRYLIYSSLYPLVFFIDKIKKYKFIKLARIDTQRIGHAMPSVEGYLVAKNFYNYDELKNCKIVFYFNLRVINRQTLKMAKRVIPIGPFSIFFTILSKALLFWKKNDHILHMPHFNIKHIIFTKNNISEFYTKPYQYFTENEKEKGSKIIKHFGIKDGDKWICIHNRDSSFLNKKFPNDDWSYHNYRNFSVNSLKSASEFFVSKGYFVLRMGYLQKEKLITTNPKIIDYANTSLRSDFLDIYLLANSEFYFGSDSGLADVSFTFKKPTHGINYSSTLLYSSRFYLPWLFTFKRIVNFNNGKLLSLREILNSEFASSDSSHLFKKHNVVPIDNSSDEIRSLAVEIIKEINGEQIEDKEDIRIQKEFWKIYYNHVDKKRMEIIPPKISPSFLRKNLDLLN